MSAPSAAHIAELAPRWERIAFHEAGHTVVGRLLDLPIHHVSLSYERKFLRWAVAGHTAVAPEGQTIEIDETRDLLFSIAGIAAEAIWANTYLGHPYKQAWRTAEQDPGNADGDGREIAACLPHTHLTYDQAADAVHTELVTAWDSVAAVAEQLRLTGQLTAHELARIV
jgi:hypothetical protein